MGDSYRDKDGRLWPIGTPETSIRADYVPGTPVRLLRDVVVPQGRGYPPLGLAEGEVFEMFIPEPFCFRDHFAIRHPTARDGWAIVAMKDVAVLVDDEWRGASPAKAEVPRRALTVTHHG